MSKLVILVLALALLGVATAATAETMSCFVDTAANDQFTPRECFAVVPGRHFATAVFRVDNLLPNAEVLWSNSQCDSSSATCAVTITAFVRKTIRATVLNPGGSWYRVSATALFENGQ